MSVGITIPLSDKPFTKLDQELKSADKQVKDLDKKIKQLNKDGKQGTDQYNKAVEQYGKSEGYRDKLKGQMKTEGSRLKYIEKMNHGREDHPFDLKQGFKGAFERNITSFARSKGVQSFLRGGALKGLIGREGSTLANIAMKEGGLAAMGEAGAFAGAVGTAAAQVLAIPAAMLFSASMTGIYSEQLRHARQDFGIKMAGLSNNSDAMILEQKRMQKLELEHTALAKSGTSFSGIPIIGSTIGPALQFAQFLRERAAGVDAYSTAKEERELHRRNMSFQAANADKLTEIATQRMWAERYGSTTLGFIAQNTIGKMKFWGSNADQEAITKKEKEIVERAEQFRQLGDTRAIEGNFAMSTALYDAANKEDTQHQNWRNPLTIWINNDAANTSAAKWAMTMNPLGAVREGM